MTTTATGPRSSLHTLDRRALTPQGRAILAGVHVREEDLTITRGLRSTARLFRVLSVVTFASAVARVGLASAAWESQMTPVWDVFMSALALTLTAGVLWGASHFADIQVKSHDDLRATRILMARLAHRLTDVSADEDTGADATEMPLWPDVSQPAHVMSIRR